VEPCRSSRGPAEEGFGLKFLPFGVLALKNGDGMAVPSYVYRRLEPRMGGLSSFFFFLPARWVEKKPVRIRAYSRKRLDSFPFPL